MGNTEPVVIIVAGGLVFLALLTIGLVIGKTQSLKRQLADIDGFLSALRGETTSTSSLASGVREHVVPSAGDKIVLSRPLPALRREFAEDEVGHYIWFSFGGLLTGLALIATFILIALVMTDDVSGAIRESAKATEEAASTKHLANAVGLLGGKFFISATGIGGSVIALLICNALRASVFRAAEHPPLELMGAFTSIEAQQLNDKLRELELLRAERETRAEQHREVCGYLSTLNTRIEKLNSIEVSVKTIGNEVSANLKNIMKDAMGEQLKELLADTMIDVTNIATSVQQNLTAAFGQQLQTVTTELQQSLGLLQKAIEGQAQGQIEKILTQLQDAVSGGFQSESQKMVAALDAFASVVPALEQQLRSMTGKVAEESRQRAEESAQMNQGLMQRVTTLLDAMSAQQTANAAAIERMQAASEQGAEAIAKRLEASGQGLVTSVLGASRAEIEAIVDQLRVAAESSAQRYGAIDSQATNAAAAVAHASEGLMRSASSIIEVANHASQLVSQTRAGSEAIQVASQQFLSAGNTLLGSVGEVQRVIASSRTQTEEQQALLLRQREYTKEVERLWPTLFDTYLAKFKEGADELGRSWDVFHQRIATVSNTVSSDFAHNTAELSEAVDQLVKQLANGKRAAT